MKIQCDVCERTPATVICCADEAVLCANCDIEVHAANKLASKHQRLQLQCLSDKLPSCDICQEKAAFIFCVEDRALFCQDCDESIHIANTLAANHQRYLATGIKVALGGSKCIKGTEKNFTEPSNRHAPQVTVKQPVQHSSSLLSPSWAVDDLFEFSEFESSDKKGALQFRELDWWADMNLSGERSPHEALAAAEVPQLPVSQPSNTIQCRSSKASLAYKRPRIEVPDDDQEFFAVPDLGRS
ncbi:hypothetical protein Ancab_008322 [Ancistrocladus abbreviatus]